MPISGVKPAVNTLLAQQKLSQAMATQQVAQSVVIKFSSGQQVTLHNATVTQSLPAGNGTGVIHITYQGGTAHTQSMTDDWSS